MTDLHLPNDTLILIATGEEAKLYRQHGAHLKQEEHWTPHNLADEGPSGKSPSEQSDRESMEATFSKQLAERLYNYAHKGKFENFVLIADPETLGEMRPLLHKEVSDKILLEMNKTLINAPLPDIEESIAAARKYKITD